MKMNAMKLGSKVWKGRADEAYPGDKRTHTCCMVMVRRIPSRWV